MKYNTIFLFTFFMLFTHQLPAQQVHTAGEMRKVMMGEDLGPHLRWDSIARQHLFGISPLGRIQGEITILDGQIFVSTVGANGQVQIQNDWEVEAPFAVYAHVPAWERFDFEVKTESESELQEALEKFMLAHGYDTSKPVPFRVQGTFGHIDYHIISKPASETEHSHELHEKAKKHFSLENTRGELLGFYSQHHEGVFTHRGSFVHIHFMDDARQNMGHLENVAITQKVALLLPMINSTLGSIHVNDTDFSKGRLGFQQDIELQDLVKFHGHLCDGLVVGFQALSEAMKTLYPDGTIDRTNTRIVSQPPPCLTDVAVYLSGGRYQFNTFYVSKAIDGLFVVQRLDTGRAVAVNLNKGVKPEAIDRLGSLAVKGELSACGLDSLKTMEDEFSDFLLKTKPSENYTVREIKDFKWDPVLQNDFVKTDVLNKNKPGCDGGH
ncbi:MAG: hypothetical protein EPO28_07000 [Saprospiraceae bacterium]|nr:MAG: hypothetical protein EPO28_07000 [Saprospiraceae bacterium]